MMENVLSEAVKSKLMKSSTASIATRLFKRGLRNQLIQGVVSVSRKSHNMAGQAFTLRYIPARPSAPTNLTLHEAVDINVPIGCGDAAVFPGDVIVVPFQFAEKIADEASH